MRTRRKRDGSVEIILDCPLCGSKANFEVNKETRYFHCWKCGHGGVYDGPIPEGVYPPLTLGKPAAPNALSNEFPDYALDAIRARGFSHEWVIERYGLLWHAAENRICWPTRKDVQAWAGRAVFPWQEPKVKTQGPKGIIGIGLLGQGQHLVLTEGDYKSAAIPAPWIGVGGQGLSLTPEQTVIIRMAEPRQVTVLYDGGCDEEAETSANQLRPFMPVLIGKLPKGAGPDDVSRRELLNAIEEAS